jgi:3'(2'), 5'-bisphosphate nucleotidase
MTYARELAVAEAAARAAGVLIRAHYDRGDVAVERKADDSPVTIADRDANACILEMLRAEFPADAILSEESADDPSRLANQRVWIVDPLDGTRDFVACTGDFAVHVGLAVGGVAVVGAVYQPVTERLYSASAGQGATFTAAGTTRRLHVSSRTNVSELRLGVSRMHAISALTEFLTATNLTSQATSIGASVKHMRLAAGELDAIVSLSTGEHDWDTCAPEIIVREAGGRLTSGLGTPFSYNQADPQHHHGSVTSNGHAHDALISLVAPFAARLSR